jgi:hypothetical protein
VCTSVRNFESKSVLASDTANATSGTKTSPRGYFSLNFNTEATFKFWLNFQDFENMQR